MPWHAALSISSSRPSAELIKPAHENGRWGLSDAYGSLEASFPVEPHTGSQIRPRRKGPPARRPRVRSNAGSRIRHHRTRGPFLCRAPPRAPADVPLRSTAGASPSACGAVAPRPRFAGRVANPTAPEQSRNAGRPPHAPRRGDTAGASTVSDSAFNFSSGCRRNRKEEPWTSRLRRKVPRSCAATPGALWRLR